MINYWDDKYGGKEENKQKIIEKLKREEEGAYQDTYNITLKKFAIKFNGIFVKNTDVKIYGRDIYGKFIEITMSKTDFETMVKESNINGGDNND